MGWPGKEGARAHFRPTSFCHPPIRTEERSMSVATLKAGKGDWYTATSYPSGAPVFTGAAHPTCTGQS